MPPKIPMASVITRATAITSGPNRKATVTEAKVLKLLVSTSGAERNGRQQPEQTAQRAEDKRLAQEADQDIEL